MIKKITKKIFALSFLFFAFSNFSYAMKVPIERVMHVVLPIGVPSILSFPFNIEAVKATSFIYKVKIKDQLNALEPFGSDNNTTKHKSRFVLSSQRPIIISRTKRTIIITPKKEGRMSLIIWGYKYPIIIDIKTRLLSTRGYDRYITFLDYSQNRNAAAKFEDTSHEKIIVDLIRGIYNNRIPEGYSYRVGTLDYVTNGLELIQVKSYIGNAYKVEEWIVKNLTNKDIVLYPQMFYTKGIYAISFENNLLKKHSSVRMFIVAKNISNQ